MIALIDGAGELIAIVHSSDGVDLTGLTVVENVPEPVHDYVWNVSAGAFEVRPPSPQAQAATAVAEDDVWAALATATPAEVAAWLTANVGDFAAVRAVLNALILALRAKT